MRAFIVITVILLTTSLLIISKDNKPQLLPQKVVPQPTQALELKVEIIHKLQNNFEKFQEQISLRPVLGASRFYGPTLVQFISEERMLISFNDGHVIGLAVVEFIPESNSFTLVKAISEYEFQYTKQNWSTLFKQYGQAAFVPENYTTSIWRNGINETFSDWTKVPENIFVK